MTASERVQDVSDAVNLARVHRFISKPLRSIEVAAIVKGAVHEAELERENELLVEELQLVIAQVRAREHELEHELDVRTRELKDVMDHLRNDSGT
jgi:response regulator RpfG family c-di-GMP phosphodiesterase